MIPNDYNWDFQVFAWDKIDLGEVVLEIWIAQVNSENFLSWFVSDLPERDSKRSGLMQD